MGQQKKSLISRRFNLQIARRAYTKAKEKERLILDAYNDPPRTRSYTQKMINNEVESSDSEIEVSEINVPSEEMLKPKEKPIINKEHEMLKKKAAKYIKYITNNTNLLPSVDPRMPSENERDMYEAIVLTSFDNTEDKEELMNFASNAEFDMEDILCLYPKGAGLLCAKFSLVSRAYIESLKGKVGTAGTRCAIMNFTKKIFLDTLIFVDREHYDNFGQYIKGSAATRFLQTFYLLSKSTFSNYIKLHGQSLPEKYTFTDYCLKKYDYGSLSDPQRNSIIKEIVSSVVLEGINQNHLVLPSIISSWYQRIFYYFIIEKNDLLSYDVSDLMVPLTDDESTVLNTFTGYKMMSNSFFQMIFRENQVRLKGVTKNNN